MDKYQKAGKPGNVRKPPEPDSQRGPGWLVLALVALGLGLRGYHYLRQPPLWHDEAALVLNVVQKDFRDFLGPLLHAEAAPPLFLYLEKAITLVLGEGLLALRLLPLAASCLALLLVTWSARQILTAAAVPWAVLLFAVSDNLLWHACEAKPYAVDVLCAAGLIALFVATRGWPLLWQVLFFTCASPFVIWVSYPGCFLCGGLAVALLPRVWPEKRCWPAFLVLLLVIGGSFLLLLLGPAHAQRCGMMEQCWVRQFPDYSRPWMVLPWIFFSTLEVLRYCVVPNGQMLAGVSLVGTIRLWQQERRDLVALLTVPTGLALLASLIHAYPYGGVRVIVYSAPAVALLVGAGVPIILKWLGTWGRLAPLACLTMVGILLVPAGQSAYRVIKPWKRADTGGAAAYVLAHRQADELVSGNHWEYDYYFRSLGSLYQPLASLSGPSSARMWLVLTADSNAERQHLVKFLTNQSWQPIAQKEFTRTQVMLLERKKVR